MLAKPIFRRHEGLFSAQYQELKERTLTAGPLLFGTPGTLHQRTGTGYAYWYRVFYPVPGMQAEILVGRADDRAAESSMRSRMAFAEWSGRQVATLRKVAFQIADKRLARLLVELHNLGAFSAGLVVLGDLAGQAWLNELGVAVRQHRAAGAPDVALELGVQPAFLDTPTAEQLPFFQTAASPAVGIRLSGLDGLRISLGMPVPPPDGAMTASGGGWAVHGTPHYDYLLEAPESAAVLAGGHCIPVLLPQAARLVWYELNRCARNSGSKQAATLRRQALGLAAALVEHDPWALLTAWERAPTALTAPIHSLRDSALAEVGAHPELSDLLADCLR